MTPIEAARCAYQAARHETNNAMPFAITAFLDAVLADDEAVKRVYRGAAIFRINAEIVIEALKQEASR